MVDWKPVTEPPTNEGWYLVTWQSAGSDERFIDYSSFSPGFCFEDRWGSNAEAIAWAHSPIPYRSDVTKQRQSPDV